MPLKFHTLNPNWTNNVYEDNLQQVEQESNLEHNNDEELSDADKYLTGTENGEICVLDEPTQTVRVEPNQWQEDEEASISIAKILSFYVNLIHLQINGIIYSRLSSLSSNHKSKDSINNSLHHESQRSNLEYEKNKSDPDKILTVTENNDKKVIRHYTIYQ